MGTVSKAIGYGIEFDVFKTDKHGITRSLICPSCIEIASSSIKVDNALLNNIEPSFGVCGVAGCFNEASYYIDGLIKR